MRCATSTKVSIVTDLLTGDMGLTDDEIAFYDALATNDSAVQAMGNDKLKLIAAELITQVKKNVTVDWNLRESARARIKVMVKSAFSTNTATRRTCRRKRRRLF